MFVQAAAAQCGEWAVAPVKTEQGSGAPGKKKHSGSLLGWPPASSRPPQGTGTDRPLHPGHELSVPRRGHSQGGPCVSSFPGCKRRLRGSLSRSGGHTAGEWRGGQSPCLLGAPRPDPPQPARKQPSSQQTVLSLWAERPENSVLQPGLPGGCRPLLAWKPAYSPAPSLGEDERVSRRACGPLEVGERRPGPGGPIPRRDTRGMGPGPSSHPTPDLRAPPPCRACLLRLIQQLGGVSAAFRRLGSFL